MRNRLVSLLVLAASLVACSDPVPVESATAEQTDRPIAMADVGVAADEVKEGVSDDMPGQAQSQAQPPADDQYQLLGIKDPDFGMVAFAMKIPRDWPARQTFQREWDGAVPINKVYLVFRSPDGRQQIEYLPVSQYIYSDGPGANDLRMQKQSMGIDPRMAENELPPMSALAYLQNILLPQMEQNRVTLNDIGNAREAPDRSETSPGSDQPHIASSASVDGMLPNGNRARIEVRVGRNELRNNQDMFYSWWVVPSITQTGAGDLDATFAHTQIAQTSIVFNPTWLSKNKELMQKGYQANSREIARNHAASMENIAQWGRINQANAKASMDRINSNAAESARRQEQQSATFNARMEQKDREHELFTDVVINSEAKYANPSTGERVKVDSRYNHTYTDNNGNYYQSDTPLRSNDVNWQEMEKVPFNDY